MCTCKACILDSTPLHSKSFFLAVDDGLHNVSRWMTWLPISLKNAAKCDKWYQLQNHPITESLNAKGAREKLSQVNPVHAISLSVEQTSNRRRPLPSNGARYFDYKSLGFDAHRAMVSSNVYDVRCVWLARWLSGRISFGYLSQMGNNNSTHKQRTSKENCT